MQKKIKGRILSAVSAAALAVTALGSFSAALPAGAEGLTGLDAKGITSKMVIGWNLGNTLDCGNTGLSSTAAPKKFATAWGNPEPTELQFQALKDGGFKGPIDKFLSPEQRAKLIEMLGMKDGDVVFFISDGKTVVDGLAGQIRTWLGENLGLIDKNKFEFCYILDFPMYELNPDTHKIDFTHNPFSMPQGGLEALETKDPLEIYAYQYDIVCNGVELSSGAVRNHNPDIMRKAFAIAGYGEEEIARKFGALYTAFQYGAPPHAGMAPGIDRMVMLLAEEDTIRDVIAFPLNGAAQDLMMNAPSEVTEEQLEEVHIRVREV